jgi:phenylpropionate dioxygenase-like ring-hydroxylating dioxygenase large terminal subunit
MQTGQLAQPVPQIANRLRDDTDLQELVSEGKAHISRRVYVDPEIFELEQERLFRKTWMFLAHESELPGKGDYVTRNLAGEPVVVVRGDDGVVRAFLNSCRHRGMRLCRADNGHMSTIRCPYHGWTYSKTGKLLSVFAPDLYDAAHLRKEALGLISVARLESYKGLVFGSWNEQVPKLEDYLGNMRFYLDLFVGRTDGGTEVVGIPQVWEVSTNWKFPTDNFTGDNFHLYSTHGSAVELGLLPPDPMSLSFGHLIRAEGGHVLHVVPGPPDPAFEYFGLPRELIPNLQRNLSAAQLALARRYAFSVGTVFPNLSFMQVLIQGDRESPPSPFLSFRFWEPIGPTKTRVWSYLFIDKEASPEYRQASYETYVRTFGPSGIYEQDDLENWEECTRVNMGKVAQRYGLHHGMGAHLDPDKSFPGPGDAWAGSYGERTQLAFYGEWQRWLTQPQPWVRQ